MKQSIIIIGGGIAGFSAAQAARDTDPDARIYLICGEKRLPYYRNRIWETIADGAENGINLRDPQWYADMRIDVVSAQAVSVDQERHTLRLSDGNFLEYDKLIITTGARPVKPEAEGYDRENVVTLRNIGDMEHLRRFPGAAVVVGSGLLALDAAWNLTKEGRAVVIVARSKRLLPRLLEKQAGIFMLYATERAGIRVALRGEVASVDDEMVLLEDGRGFDASLVVLATGVKSDIRFGKKLGTMYGRGIVVDDRMHTTMPDIWAAGDCAEHNDLICDNLKTAMEQGRTAGICAAGGDAVYKRSREEYTLKAMGTELWVCGDTSAEDVLVYRDSRLGNFVGLCFRDEVLVGAELIGDISNARLLANAMDNAMSRAEAADTFLK